MDFIVEKTTNYHQFFVEFSVVGEAMRYDTEITGAGG
jgi:hypothetical protein